MPGSDCTPDASSSFINFNVSLAKFVLYPPPLNLPTTTTTPRDESSVAFNVTPAMSLGIDLAVLTTRSAFLEQHAETPVKQQAQPDQQIHTPLPDPRLIQSIPIPPNSLPLNPQAENPIIQHTQPDQQTQTPPPDPQQVQSTPPVPANPLVEATTLLNQILNDQRYGPVLRENVCAVAFFFFSASLLFSLLPSPPPSH